MMYQMGGKTTLKSLNSKNLTLKLVLVLVTIFILQSGGDNNNSETVMWQFTVSEDSVFQPHRDWLLKMKEEVYRESARL